MGNIVRFKLNKERPPKVSKGSRELTLCKPEEGGYLAADMKGSLVRKEVFLCYEIAEMAGDCVLSKKAYERTHNITIIAK
jgi:hypothetical protein